MAPLWEKGRTAGELASPQGGGFSPGWNLGSANLGFEFEKKYIELGYPLIP